MGARSVREAGDIRGKRVFVRADFNVPVRNGVILDTLRIEKAFSTLLFLKDKGAKIIIGSHTGDTGNETPASVYEYIKNKFPDTLFSKTIVVDEELVRYTKNLAEGQILLLENLRKNDGEKKNDDSYARALASLADIYVNEAFSASHRRHASIVGAPKYLPHYAGDLFLEELKNLGRAFNPEHPFVLVLGGAKFETKLPIIKKFVDIADDIFVYGAPAHSFFKARGYETGVSLIDTTVDVSDMVSVKKIHIPFDVIVQNEKGREARVAGGVLSGECILDAGPESVRAIGEKLKNAKMVLWNGPLGDYEHGFGEGTVLLARTIAESAAFSIIGGGDTVAAIANLKSSLREKFGFISTGGGAMLAYLAEGTLPGIEALK